jgi:transposase
MLKYKDIKKEDKTTGETLRNLLNIKDVNIRFPEKPVRMEKYNKKTSKIIYAVLDYDPTHCENCGCKNVPGRIIRHGTKSSDIRLIPFQGFQTILRLFKQRFLCKECDTTFSAKTYAVDENCDISKSLKFSIAIDIKKLRSMKDIAKDHFVSSKTVERVMESFFDERCKNKNYLPENLMVDEFKGTKDCEGSMCFIVSDAKTGEIFEILDDRRNFKLTSYFEKFTYRARKSVKSVVMDMNASYQTFVTAVFPNAKIIIDRFHVVQQITRAFNKLRVKVMNGLNRNNNEEAKYYRKLKKYWKKLLKKDKNINYSSYKQFPLFRNAYVTESDVIDALLAKSDELRLAYGVYQDLLFAFEEKDDGEFFHILNNLPDGLNADFKKSIVYLKRHKDGICAALHSPFSNGKLEGTNNIIKVIKRIGFGFRKFENFRKRILIQQGIFEVID